jgi:hypothetical protein
MSDADLAAAYRGERPGKDSRVAELEAICDAYRMAAIELHAALAKATGQDPEDDSLDAELITMLVDSRDKARRSRDEVVRALDALWADVTKIVHDIDGNPDLQAPNQIANRLRHAANSAQVQGWL